MRSVDIRELRTAADMQGLSQEFEALMDELDALRKDAERYRWLRDTGNNTWVPFTAHWKMDAAHCDHTIDDAMATKPKA